MKAFKEKSQFGPGRDFSQDPPIIWDGYTVIPDTWRLALPLAMRPKRAKMLGAPPRDPYATAAWRESHQASAEAILRARERNRSIARGEIEQEKHDFGGVLDRLCGPEPKQPKPVSKADHQRLLPARLRSSV